MERRVGDDRRAGECLGLGDWVEQRDVPAAGGAQRGQRTGDRGRPGDPQDGGGKMRFHVDLQRSPRMTGHDELDDAVTAAALGRCVLRQPQEARLTVGHRPERLAHDDRLGAAAADPALDRAVRMDDPGCPGTR
jgi:hypothetical protein